MLRLLLQLHWWTNPQVKPFRHEWAAPRRPLALCARPVCTVNDRHAWVRRLRTTRCCCRCRCCRSTSKLSASARNVCQSSPSDLAAWAQCLNRAAAPLPPRQKHVRRHRAPIHLAQLFSATPASTRAAASSMLQQGKLRVNITVETETTRLALHWVLHVVRQHALEVSSFWER